MDFKSRWVKTTVVKNPYTDRIENVVEPNVAVIVRDLVVVLGLIITLIVCWPFNSVPTGHRGVVTQFGKIIGLENEGLVVLPPWQKLSVFNVRSETTEVKNAQGATMDQQPVNVTLTVRYSIEPTKVAMVFEQFSKDGNLDSYVTTATQEVFKAVTAQYKAPELIAKRPTVSMAIMNALRTKLAQYGAQVHNIDVQNFSFSPDYMAAVSEKVTQEQKKLAADNRVLTVESEQKVKVAVAEAEATALKAKADGEAYASLTAAKAQADALRIQNAALAQNKDVLELRRIEVDMKKAEKWDGALPQNIYAGAPVPFLNINQGK